MIELSVEQHPLLRIRAFASPPFRAAIALAGSKYVFNTAGQEIDVSGLVCLLDTEGPCGNAVKDSVHKDRRRHAPRAFHHLGLHRLRAAAGRCRRLVPKFVARRGYTHACQLLGL